MIQLTCVLDVFGKHSKKRFVLKDNYQKKVNYCLLYRHEKE